MNATVEQAEGDDIVAVVDHARRVARRQVVPVLQRNALSLRVPLTLDKARRTACRF